MNLEFSIVIISYKRNEELEKCIQSCEEHTQQMHEIVVIDNASDPRTEALIKKLNTQYHCIKYVDAKENLGVAGGRNLGYKIAQSNVCYFIDDDAMVVGERNVIDKMIQFIKNNHEVSSIGTCCNDSIRGFLVGFPVKGGKYEDNCEIINYVGCSHVIMKDRYPYEILYPEKLLYGAEERFAGLAIIRAGKKTLHYNGLTVEHHPSPKGRDSWENNELSSYVNEEIIKGLFLPGLFVCISRVFFIGRYVKHSMKWKCRISQTLSRSRELKAIRGIKTKEFKLSYKQVFELINKYGVRNAV